MYLKDVRIIDKKNSILDDGGTEELRRKHESLEHKLSSAKKEDKPKIEKAVEKAKVDYETALKAFEANVKEWRRTGRYVFKEKRYVDYIDRGRRPYWKFEWMRHVSMNDYRESADAMADGWTFVEADKSEYVPELIASGADNCFHFGGDVILMKIPLYDYLKKLEENRLISDGASAAARAKFRAQAEREGADVSQEMIDEWASKVKLR